MSKTGFKDRSAPKKIEKPMEPMPTAAFSFKPPHYDERHSCFVRAGQHYGDGIIQPVGSIGPCKAFSDSLPMGRVDTMRFAPK